MRYYKMLSDGYIDAIGTGYGGTEITEAEYSELMAIIQARPTPEEGYSYKLREDLTWELVEVPVIETEEEATEQDYLDALAEMGVEV